MTTGSNRSLKVFLSSPGGLDAEKQAARRVIDDINTTWGPLVGVKLDLWNYEQNASSRISGDEAQDEIFSQLGAFPLYVGLMHGRFGSPTSRAGSGTEDEFMRALYLHQLMESGRPQIMFFFKNSQIEFTSDSIEQARKVINFKNRVGERGLHQSFVDKDEFSYLLGKALFNAVASRKADTSPPRVKPIFLHFLDHFFLMMLDQFEPARPIESELRDLVRIAYLLSGELFISCSSYVESPVCRRLIDELSLVQTDGADSSTMVRAVERGESWPAFLEKAVLQRTADLSDSYQVAIRQRLRLPDHVAFQPRRRSATKDILNGWSQDIASGKLDNLISDQTTLFGVPHSEMRSRFTQVPTLLNGKDVIAPQVARCLIEGEGSESSVLVSKLHEIINRLYFDSIVSEFSLATLSDFRALPTSLRINTPYELSMRKVREYVDRKRKLKTRLSTLKVQDYEHFRRERAWSDAVMDIALMFRGVE